MKKKRWQFNRDGVQLEFSAYSWEEVVEDVLDCLTPVEE